ncbi:hypothetical protein AX16_001461 [Volvariella volvacea WC 439]|nr:hypothetical protein AX16_001461 [Volvariella volvacea WC 439]
MQEAIFCALAPNAQGAGPGLISLYDIHNGTSLASFKQTSAAVNCTDVVESVSGQGGFFLAAQTDKAILNVYNFQKDQMALKIVLPEKLSCIAVEQSGRYCAGGTAQGRVYLWEVASGILFNVWDAHYRQVTVLRFTQDGHALMSGSEDSGVGVWSVSRLILLLDNDLQNDIPEPYCLLSDHTLPITDIRCGVGPFPKCRILTSSVDHSVKLWDIASKTLLTTFQFPKIVTSLAWDVTERLFFGASADGSIFQVNFFKQRELGSNIRVAEAVGGGGLNEILRVGDSTEQKRLIEVNEPIASLTISLTASHLVVGTALGFILIYDVPSHQLIRTISTHKSFSITYIKTMLKPMELVGHFNSNSSIGKSDSKDFITLKPVVPFHKTKDIKAREAHEAHVLLPPSIPLDEYHEDEFMEELLRDHAVFMRPDGTDGQSPPLQTRIDDLEAEVIHLKEQLQKAKGINDVMWDNVVQRLLLRGKDEIIDPSEPKRKKGRA